MGSWWGRETYQWVESSDTSIGTGANSAGLATVQSGIDTDVELGWDRDTAGQPVLRNRTLKDCSYMDISFLLCNSFDSNHSVPTLDKRNADLLHRSYFLKRTKGMCFDIFTSCKQAYTKKNPTRPRTEIKLQNLPSTSLNAN